MNIEPVGAGQTPSMISGSSLAPGKEQPHPELAANDVQSENFARTEDPSLAEAPRRPRPATVESAHRELERLEAEVNRLRARESELVIGQARLEAAVKANQAVL